MSVDERTRRDMYTGLEAALGAPVADAVMAHLPPTGWADVARTHDVEVLRGDVDLLRGDVVALGDGLRREMVALGDGLRREMISIEERIGLRLDARIASESNRLLLLLIPTMTTIVGLAFAAAKLS
jgi:hypothetical protein